MPNLPVVIGSGAVFHAAFRGDLLNQKPDVFDGERSPGVAEGNMRVRVFQVRFDPHAYLAADARVFGVLNQLPHPTFRYRRRRIHTRPEFGQFLVDLRRNDLVERLMFQRGEFFCKRHGFNGPLSTEFTRNTLLREI